MIELTPARRRDLRAGAHHLNPVVSIAGNGLTPAVLGEIDRCLQAHELVKIKVHGAERGVREELMNAICGELDASPVQHIGTILVVWRERRVEADKPGSPKPSTPPPIAAKAKSARAFAAAARRTALIKSASDKKRAAAKRTRAHARKPDSAGSR